MTCWETADQHPSEPVRDFARIWKATPKIVFSTTLELVEPRTFAARVVYVRYRRRRLVR